MPFMRSKHWSQNCWDTFVSVCGGCVSVWVCVCVYKGCGIKCWNLKHPRYDADGQVQNLPWISDSWLWLSIDHCDSCGEVGGRHMKPFADEKREVEQGGGGGVFEDGQCIWGKWLRKIVVAILQFWAFCLFLDSFCLQKLYWRHLVPELNNFANSQLCCGLVSAWYFC